MPYHILLPAFEIPSQHELSEAMAEFDSLCLSADRPQWQVQSLPWEPESHVTETVLVTLYRAGEVGRQSYDAHWHEPRGVKAWLEVLLNDVDNNRQARFRMRMLAMVLANRLELPVLETRNGVYCRTAAAFSAWCSRQPHRHIIPLTHEEYFTELPPENCSIVDQMIRPATSVYGSAAQVTVVEHPPTQDAPLPSEKWWLRVWRAAQQLHPYAVPVARRQTAPFIETLLIQARSAFQPRNVLFDKRHHRIIIYAKSTPGVWSAIRRLREQAQTVPRGGLRAA